MLTYKGVAFHGDEEAGIVYFWTESRLAFCKECPMAGTGKMQLDENTTLESLHGCPCSNLRGISSGSISMPAYRAIRDTDSFDEFIESIKAQDMPIGMGKKNIIIP